MNYAIDAILANIIQIANVHIYVHLMLFFYIL